MPTHVVRWPVGPQQSCISDLGEIATSAPKPDLGEEPQHLCLVPWDWWAHVLVDGPVLYPRGVVWSATRLITPLACGTVRQEFKGKAWVWELREAEFRVLRPDGTVKDVRRDLALGVWPD